MTKTTQKRSKILYIILSVILALVAAAGISVAFLLNYNTYAPKAPMVLDDGQNIYITSSLNDNYKGYRFEFKENSGKEIIIDSDSNQLSCEELFENKLVLGKTYDIRVCYLAENVGNNSEYSKKISWKFQTYLETPEMSFSISSSTLNWTEVENADFYRVYVSGQEEYFETEATTFDLSVLQGGEKTVSVTSHSNNENYLTANKSNSLDISLIKYIKPFNYINFNQGTKVLTAKSKEEYQKINVYLNAHCYECNYFKVEKIEEDFVYTIDLNLIYSNEESIGICPTSIDEYNIYNSGITYYQAEI